LLTLGGLLARAAPPWIVILLSGGYGHCSNLGNTVPTGVFTRLSIIGLSFYFARLYISQHPPIIHDTVTQQINGYERDEPICNAIIWVWAGRWTQRSGMPAWTTSGSSETTAGVSETLGTIPATLFFACVAADSIHNETAIFSCCLFLSYPVPHQLTGCGWCGSALGPSRHLLHKTASTPEWRNIP
jgi:hypothetical protein